MKFVVQGVQKLEPEQTDTQTHRQTHRQTNRQTHRQTHHNIYKYLSLPITRARALLRPKVSILKVWKLDYKCVRSPKDKTFSI